MAPNRFEARALDAVHEAGHVAVGALLGFRPTHAFIRQFTDLGGMASFQYKPLRTEDERFSAVMVYLSGRAAEQRFAEMRGFDLAPGSDGLDRVEACKRLPLPTVALDAVQAALRDRMHGPALWNTVERIAVALLREGHVFESEMPELLNKAGAPHWGISDWIDEQVRNYPGPERA